MIIDDAGNKKKDLALEVRIANNDRDDNEDEELHLYYENSNYF